MRFRSWVRVAGLVFGLLLGAAASAACTGNVTIAALYPREGGWIHVIAEGMTNMDINGCGVQNQYLGLLFNVNDTGGTLEGKKMLLSIILTAHAAGRSLRLCSDSCDSQYPQYSSLDYIDALD